METKRISSNMRFFKNFQRQQVAYGLKQPFCKSRSSIQAILNMISNDSMRVQKSEIRKKQQTCNIYIYIYIYRRLGGVRPTGKSISVSVRACVRRSGCKVGIRTNRDRSPFPFPFSPSGLSLFHFSPAVLTYS